MNKPQDPVAAETDQTTNVPAVDLSRLVRLEISDVRWEYEDGLPEMEDADFDAIFPASRVLGMECGGVRMYPFVEDSAGNRVWISYLPNSKLPQPDSPSQP